MANGESNLQFVSTVGLVFLFSLFLSFRLRIVNLVKDTGPDDGNRNDFPGHFPVFPETVG